MRSRNLSIAMLLLAGATLTYANKTGGPVFTLLGVGGPAKYDYGFSFIDSQGTRVDFGLAVAVLAGATISDGDLGKIIYERMSQNNSISAEYDLKWERGNDLYFRVILTPKTGKNPKVVKDSVTLTPGSKSIYLAAGVDPLSGDATFNLSGAATATSGSGEVFIGVNGFIVDVPTSNSMGPRSLQQIKTEVIGGLVQLGFTGVYEDLNGEIVVPGVSTGGNLNSHLGSTDLGAAFMSTDPGIGGSAQMAPGAMANPRPPRGIVNVSPGRGPAGTTVTVRISGFPANSNINITLNGQQVGTITTNASGTGSTTFVAPAGPAGIPLEVRAAGGNPVTFGYGWFTITPPAPPGR